MSSEQDRDRAEAKRLYDLEWEVQPRWAKLLTWTVGLPAWLVILFDVFTDRVSEDIELASFLAFMAVVFVQIFCGIRAQKRGEL